MAVPDGIRPLELDPPPRARRPVTVTERDGHRRDGTDSMATDATVADATVADTGPPRADDASPADATADAAAPAKRRRRKA